MALVFYLLGVYIRYMPSATAAAAAAATTTTTTSFSFCLTGFFPEITAS